MPIRARRWTSFFGSLLEIVNCTSQGARAQVLPRSFGVTLRPGTAFSADGYTLMLHGQLSPVVWRGRSPSRRWPSRLDDRLGDTDGVESAHFRQRS